MATMICTYINTEIPRLPLPDCDCDPVARAEKLLSEAKQMAEMLSSAKGFSADAGGHSAPFAVSPGHVLGHPQ